MQGWGWLAMEELWWNDNGELDDACAVDVQDSDRRATCRARLRRRLLGAAEPRGDDLPLEGGRRAAVACSRCRRSTRCATRSRASPTIASRRALDAPATDERILRGGRRPSRTQRADAACAMTTRSPDRVARARVAARTARAVARQRRRDANGSTPREAGHARWSSTRDDASTAPSAAAISSSKRCGIARDALATRDAGGAWLVRFPLAARPRPVLRRRRDARVRSRSTTRAAWLDAAPALRAHGAPFALVAPDRRGDARRRTTASSPPTTSRGSLGDAALDSAAIVARARAPRAATAAPRSCARRTRRRVDAARPRRARRPTFDVVLFGNGHVGRALVQVLGALPARVRWIDAREDDFPGGVPANVEVVVTDTPEAEVAHAPRGAYVVVTTHSHALDFALVEAALARDDLALPRPDRLEVEARAVREAARRARHAAERARAHHLPDRRTAGRSRARSRARSRSRVAAEMLAVREASDVRRAVSARPSRATARPTGRELVTDRRRRRRAAAPRARAASPRSTRRSSPTTASTSTSRPARSTRCSARTAPASRR